MHGTQQVRLHQVHMNAVLPEFRCSSLDVYFNTLAFYYHHAKYILSDVLPCGIAWIRKQLRHADILWFDENFLAALRALLPEVRSMFGFGSGRGDFERYFYDQVCWLPEHFYICNYSSCQICRVFWGCA